MIKHAAIIDKNGNTHTGKSHADCFEKALANNAPVSGASQGFITDKGVFVDRHDAAKIAFETKQIDRRINILFSEDLWSERENGKFNYSEELGYVLK